MSAERRAILLLGAQGQVGWELRRALMPLGEVLAATRADCDLGDAGALRQCVRAARPAIIVNAAAYTAVDRAETDEAAALAINGVAPGVLAEEASRCGAWLVHYSTDYVFDGGKATPYGEDDATNPQSAYGRSKLAGENAVAQCSGRHLVFRTSWVFGRHGQNFLKTILRLAREREEIRVVDDQFGAPTSAALIADVTAHALHAAIYERLGPGLYHLASAGVTSWHGYAVHAVAQARQRIGGLRLEPGRIVPVPTEGYPLPAVRPKNSRLDCRRLEAALGLTLPDWQTQVDLTLSELCTS